ncbi:TetR/AcrR family transcriptional regulator [Streptomyces sp. NPDC018833]|uniref:TetR/AcrR family transcriptional regulator n=1 Tax=Streptomyces sp. NPDC018833 TaxID=3365053 RepID=UPI0037B33A9E
MRDSESGWGRRAGDCGRYGRLSAARVVATALDIVDREGLSALSMRRLGAELGVEAMALYRYAAGKDALLDGMVEALNLEVQGLLAAGGEEATPPVGTAQHPEWRTELHRAAEATYRVSMAHPRVAPLLAMRMPAVLKEHKRVLVLLEQAGLDESGVSGVFRAFTSWVLGYVFVELRAMVDNPDEPDPAFRLGLHRMPAQELPRLREIAPAIAEHGGLDGLATGLDALLDRFARDA